MDEYRGPKALGDGLSASHEAVPDGHGDILHLHVDGEGTGVVEWRMSGTNTGPLHCEAPTGRSFTLRGCSVATITRACAVSRRGVIVAGAGGF